MTNLVLSLFPGIGLLDMAFESEGFVVVRGPDVLWGGDIRRFHPPADTFNGVIGGPPCQTFSSLVRLVQSRGHQTRFGNLIPEFERCVAEAQPNWYVMENVPNAPEPTVPGYGVKSFLLDNSLLLGENGMGLEQRRLRRFSFGMRGCNNVPSLMHWIDLCVFTQNNMQPTVTSSDGGSSVRMRRYSLADALRLQGLPEGFLDDAPFTAEGKLKAVANGVPLPMGRAIARAVREAITNEIATT